MFTETADDDMRFETGEHGPGNELLLPIVRIVNSSRQDLLRSQVTEEEDQALALAMAEEQEAAVGAVGECH